ncbi:MAG: hypothetical protein K6F48_00995 [Paludibacteraceae bacterium]|nr:hypothetical protein [Paludibacteraceae bacterium]
MATMTITYDARNTYVKNILSLLLESGIIKEKENNTEKELRKAFKEASVIKKEIKKGNRGKLKTLDDFLEEVE